MKPGLFVYGTLHPNRAPESIRDVVSRLLFLSSGTVQGRLLELGEYPGLVFDGELTSVNGEVFALPDDAETLPALDAYEGFDARDHHNSLFIRELCDITMVDGGTECHWIYLYNRSNASS